MDKLPLEVQIGESLTTRKMTLATAESCTGGLLSHRITNVPGSSTYFVGGVVAYANRAKMALLGVRPETLDTFGAVSEASVLEMARGVRLVLKADIGVAISGIAGPGGGTPEKPVGLVWIGVSDEVKDQASSYVWTGDRLAIKEQSAQAALELIYHRLAR